MNKRMVFYIIGQILKIEALLLLLPAAVALYSGEGGGAFLITMALCLAVGLALSWKRPQNTVIYAREGFVVVALSWLAMSAFGALPFVISGEIPFYVDAFFEMVSGFTTTGASILIDIESMSRGMLFWRSLSHWVGGMGVLVFLMAVLPMAGDRSMHLMRAEVPGPTVGKLVPKMRDTAKILYGIYLALTILEIILLILGGMPLYDSLIHTFGTAGTGGFSSKAASVAAYGSAYIDGVIGVFMILFGVNFNLYFLVLLRSFKQIFKNEELRCYLGVIAASVAVITVNIRPLYEGLGQAFRYAFFQVSSIITTTGYATADFNLWPELSRTILVVLMFVGACAGSTGGGMKVARIILLYRMAKRGISQLMHPRSVGVVRLEGRPLEEQTLADTGIYFITYMAIACATVLLLSVDGFSFETNVTAMAACLNNIGPGLDLVGPVGSYAAFSPFSKLVLCFNMLAGRLEVFPLLILLAPSVWKKQ